MPSRRSELPLRVPWKGHNTTERRGARIMCTGRARPLTLPHPSYPSSQQRPSTTAPQNNSLGPPPDPQYEVTPPSPLSRMLGRSPSTHSRFSGLGPLLGGLESRQVRTKPLLKRKEGQKGVNVGETPENATFGSRVHTFTST